MFSILNLIHLFFLLPIFSLILPFLSQQTASYESRKPLGSWVHNLYMRVDFFAQWAEMILNSVEKLMKPVLVSKAGAAEVDFTDVPRSQPYSYWLSGFFFPQGRLTVVVVTFTLVCSGAGVAQGFKHGTLNPKVPGSILQLTHSL